MASVDGSRSIIVASDELCENFCDPCKLDGIQRDGSHYCENCDEYLCHNCKYSHKRFKTSRNHKVLSGKEVSRSSLKHFQCTVLCACEHNLAVSVYCQDHDEVLRQTCKAVKHRKCKTGSLKEKSASYDVSKLTSLFENVKSLKNKIQTFLQGRKAEIQQVESMTQTCKREIRNFRQELDIYLDTLEKNILADLEKHAKQMRQEINNHISSCLTPTKLLEIDLKMLEDAKRSGETSTMFAADIKASSRLKELQSILKDTQKEAKSPVLDFETNPKLMDIKEHVKTFGTLTVKEILDKKIEKKSFLGMKVDNIRETDMKLPDEIANPWITGCAFMPDGQLMLCDRENNKIKTLSSSFEIIGNHKLKGSPWDVSVVDSSTAIITLPDTKQLQYIKLVPFLQAGRIIQLDIQCFGVEVVDGEIYTMCNNCHGIKEVRNMDMAGNIIRKTDPSLGQESYVLFSIPLYLALSTIRQKIYISDFGTSSVACLKSDGSCSYYYTDSNLLGSRGVLLDDEDNILVCGEFSSNIHVVTSDGKKQCLLVASQYGIHKPCSLAYRQSDDTLVVGCRGFNLAILKLVK